MVKQDILTIDDMSVQSNETEKTSNKSEKSKSEAIQENDDKPPREIEITKEDDKSFIFVGYDQHSLQFS